MTNKSYIIQNMQQFSKIDFLLEKDNDLDWYLREKEGEIQDISFDTLFKSKNKRYMIVAEPGYGKTRLLKEIVLQSTTRNIQAFFIDAKKIKSLFIEESIDKCKYISDLDISEESLQKLALFKTTNNSFSNSIDTVISIDALDEVAVSDLYELLEKIEEFIENNSNIKIFLSCRTHHLKKINFNFDILDFKFITLEPFRNIEIKQFLENRLNKKIDLESMYQKSKMSNLISFISIPRYLYYFAELLKDGSLEEIINMSRSKMFEHFIYRKLDKELQKNTPKSQIDLLKRVLEKLAFIMKIDGVSEITKDELMTVFDKMDSNFSQIAFRDDLIQKLYDRSLIKDNIETVEFENQEFLDYLSAKELSRFEKVEQVFFDVAIEPHIMELYTSWFYVLPFVFELKPNMIEIFLDFLNRNDRQVFSSEYFKALLDIEPEKVSKELKSKIFDMVFDYYTSHIKWFDALGGRISNKLVRYYDDSKYQKILDSIDGRKDDDSLIVLRTNAIRLISLLIEDKKIDKDKIEFWQGKVYEWLNEDIEKYHNLHTNIIEEFDKLSNGDFEWIKKYRFIFEKGIQVQAEYARACNKIAPNDIFSIDIYLDTDRYWRLNKKDKNLTRSNIEYDYILKLNTVESLEYALEKIWNNKSFYYRFCENLDRGIFKETKVEEFKANLLNICNDEFLEFLKNLIIKSIDKYDCRYDRYCNGVYQVFLEVILERDKKYLKEYISILKNNYLTKNRYYYYFIDYLPISLISKYFNEFENAIRYIENENIYFNILRQIYHYAPEISEIRKKIIEINNNIIPDYEQERQVKICRSWREKIEPEAGKFITDLFRFFNNNKASLQRCKDYEENYKNTVKIAKEVLKNNNPLIVGKVEKKEKGGATIWQVDYYESCINFVYKEKIDLDQEIVDNIFRYLPFNINSDYETTLAVAKTPSSKAIQDIIDVYAGKRDDDLGTYHVRQFTELYNTMKLAQFEPVLLKMLENEDIEEYKKIYIVQSLPTNVLTVEVIKRNKNELKEDSNLYQEYLSILIRKYQDKDSIEEAFEWTKKRAKEMKNKSSFYDPMSEIENNISINMAYTNYSIEKDKELLLLSSELSKKGNVNGSRLLTKLVETHLKYLTEINPKAYEVILNIEKFLEVNKDKKSLHWFEYTLQDLKKVYLGKVKKSNIAKAIKKYNQLENEDYLPISSSIELRELIKDIIEEDIRQWIESEGAYKYINELSKKTTNTNAEDFIQKSIKSQIELSLLKRGFRDTDYSIVREEQLLDDKRLDFTVRYGFVGSVMIELKLGHNNEAKPTTKDGKEYIEKLKKYMTGSNSDYGLFVIFNVKDEKNKFEKQMINLHKLYEDVEDISILGLDCILK